VPGFTCAAKEYTGGTVDTTKPIIILVHGNSASPNSWEEYTNTGLKDGDPNTDGIQLTSASQFQFTADDPAKAPRKMLASKLVAAGYRVIAVDFRTDLVPYLKNANLSAGPTDPGYGDAAGNIDHGWAVPILQSLLKSVISANPNQKISLVGHSLGTTVIQDALRRTYNEFKAGTFATNPFSKVKGVVLASGAIHGVSKGTVNCTTYTTMRGKVNCEMGDRDNYKETDFHKGNNGPQDLFAVPCADGSYAYNKQSECGGNAVKWFTTTIKDSTGATLRDEFVSQAAARINMDDYDVTTDTVKDPECVVNNVNPVEAYDTSGYFMDIGTYQGFLANHFGSIRSDAGMTFILDALTK
jgi:pimeloyl-ACP methyl ester carboxylesterase